LASGDLIEVAGIDSDVPGRVPLRGRPNSALRIEDHLLNACGRSALGLVLIILGARLTLAGTVAVAGSVSGSAQSVTVPHDDERALQSQEPTRCSRLSNFHKEISCFEHAWREAKREGNYAEAELLLKQELAIVEKQLPQSDPRVTRVLRRLALAYLGENKWAEAKPIYDRLLQAPLPPLAADCAGEHYWGDEIHCYVTFHGTPLFSHLEMVFNLPSDDYRQADAPQPGQFINFVLRDSKKISRHTYEVSGTDSHSVPGIYILAGVSAKSDYGYRMYSNGYQFSSALVVRVKAPDAEKPFARESSAATDAPFDVRAKKPELRPEIRAEIKPLPKLNLAVEETPSAVEDQAIDRNTCGGKHKPGETMTCYVVFEKEDDNDSVQMAFSTPIGAIVRGGLCNGFMLDKWRRVDSRTFEVSGVIPYCTSFTYVLTTVLVETNSRGYVQYQNGTDFKSGVSIELRNSNRTLFPEIGNVGLVARTKR
jgi:hypothetical protein